MTVTALKSCFELNLLLALAREPKGAAITGHLLQMLSLAANDPEGCVRLAPADASSAGALAETFHCSAEAMQLSLDTLKKFGVVFEEEGKLYFRAKKKKKEKRKDQRKDKVKEKIINNMQYANNSYFTRGGKTQNSPAGEKERNCLPFVPGEETEENEMIPLEELPEDCRKIVDAWNRLGLKTFYGLYPALIEKVERLLLQYNMDTILGGIASVANSAFLLGKSKFKRFKITLGWLLDPKNFAKVLTGKYRDQFDEYDEWLDGEPLPCSLTGEPAVRTMTREERRQAVKALWNPLTPEKAEAAQLLGIA